MTDSVDDDPWAFIAPKRDEGAVPTIEPPTVTSVRAQRERGELRAEMGGPSLRRRAWPVALSLALLTFAGYLTEMVASSQMLALVGPVAPLIVFPLGGLGLIALAVVQFRFIDHRARLPMIRMITLLYAAAFAIATALMLQSIIPAIAVGIIWLLADQLNFLLPLLLWSLASDEFNVAESRKIYPWIVTITYLGQVLGLGVAAVSPWVLERVDVSLAWLLVVPPVLCALVALWLPRVLRNSHAAKGAAQQESTMVALASARDFIVGVPVWRHLLSASVLTFVSGLTLYLLFLVEAEAFVGADAARLQTILGFSALGWYLACWAIQHWLAERLQNRIGIPGVLLILPLAVIIGGLIMVFGALTASLALAILGVSFWVVLRYSIDENARRSALAFVPDERRARVSFVVDLLPVALGLIFAGPLAFIGMVTGSYWIVALVCVVIAAVAVAPSLVVRRDWDESLLNWRLRRRKQNRSLEL